MHNRQLAPAMAGSMRLTWLLAALVGATPCGAVTLSVDEPALQACLARTLPRQDMQQTLAFKVFDATGSVSESRAELYWQRSATDKLRVLVRLSAPPTRAGVALLAVEGDREEPDLFLYLPELRQTRRVAGRTFAGSMLGTDFSYEDYIQFQGLRNGSEIRRRDDTSLDGQAVYVLEATPRDSRSGYGRVISYIDQAACLPLRIEFRAGDGQLLKELLVDRASIETEGDRAVPHRAVMHDHRQNSRTELVVEQAAFDVGLRDDLFRPSTLGTVP